MFIKSICVLTALLCFTTLVGGQESQLVTVESIASDLNMHACKNEERLDAVKRLFKKVGAAEDDIKIEKYGDVENLILTKRGTTDEIVIIGAHYDKVDDGCGAIDNWTGLTIIANVYRYVKPYKTTKTYLFVAFGKEEKGLIGSNAMAKAIPKESRSLYCSMVNFDSFGFGYPQVLTNTSNSKMTKLAKDMASEAKMPFNVASLAGIADADSSSFLSRDIPAITFHGLSNRWQEYLHSSRDKIANVNVESVFVGYNFAAMYITKLDELPCSAFRK